MFPISVFLRTYTGRSYDNFAIVLQTNCLYSCLNAYQKVLATRRLGRQLVA